jgi:hypothetical protein
MHRLHDIERQEILRCLTQCDFVRCGRTNRAWHRAASARYAQQLFPVIEISSRECATNWEALQFINTPLGSNRRIHLSLFELERIMSPVFLNRLMFTISNHGHRIEILHTTLDRQTATDIPIESMSNLRELRINGYWNITPLRSFMSRLFQSCHHIHHIHMASVFDKNAMHRIFSDPSEIPQSLTSINCRSPTDIPPSLASRLTEAHFCATPTKETSIRHWVEALKHYHNLERLELSGMTVWNLPTLRAILTLPRLSTLEIRIPTSLLVHGFWDEKGRMFPHETPCDYSRRLAALPEMDVGRYPPWLHADLWGEDLSKPVTLYGTVKIEMLMKGLAFSTCTNQQEPNHVPPHPLKSLVFRRAGNVSVSQQRFVDFPSVTICP